MATVDKIQGVIKNWIGRLNYNKSMEKVALTTFLIWIHDCIEKVRQWDPIDAMRKDSKLKQFLFYATRWQLSTPILWFVIWWLGPGLTTTIIANAIGSAIFFWVDRWIFKRTRSNVQEWEFMFGEPKEFSCPECGKDVAELRRLKYDPRGYDKRDDPNPKFLCKFCSPHKYKRINDALVKKRQAKEEEGNKLTWFQQLSQRLRRPVTQV